jgi:hypothetical protein
MIETKTNFEQINKMEKKALVRFFALAVPLVLAIVVMTLSSQAANAQITPAQQQALKSLVATGYTNSYPINPPRAWCGPGCPNISVKYSINLGQLVAIVPDQPRTSLDVVLAPTQHQTTYGFLTMQIPRWALDSKNPSGTDTPFRVTLDGHGLAWSQIQQDNTHRVLGFYFGADNGFLQIFGNQGAVTKAFPTNH